MEQLKDEIVQYEKSLQTVFANYRRFLEPLSHITVAELLAVSHITRDKTTLYCY